MRTLCVAVRSVPEASWEQWRKTLAQSATMATCDRDALLEKLYDQMERELQVGSPFSSFYTFILFIYFRVMRLIVTHSISLSPCYSHATI